MTSPKISNPICCCGLTAVQHKEDYKAYIDSGKWKRYIKDKCVVCKTAISTKPKRYLLKGNWCDDCITKLTKK